MDFAKWSKSVVIAVQQAQLQLVDETVSKDLGSDFISEVEERCKFAKMVIGEHPDGRRAQPDEQEALEKLFWELFFLVKPKAG